MRRALASTSLITFLVACGAPAATPTGASRAPAAASAEGGEREARSDTTTVTMEPPHEQPANVTVTHGDPAVGPVVAGAQEQPAAGPSAMDRVRAALGDVSPTPADEAAWFPFRALESVARASGELPAPVPPEFEDDRVVWSLVASAVATTPDPASRARVCDEVTRAEPRIACAADVVTVGATTRLRYAFAWRRAPGRIEPDLALPMRALGRLSTGACLLSAERTLHTLEFRVQFPSVQSLGTSLALLATVPDLSDVIMVEAQPAPASSGAPAGALRATLSWPTDRADREHGDLAGDAWPARCDDRLTLGTDAAPGAHVTALAVLRGQRAQGAVLNLNHREWIVTEGDTVGDATVTAVADAGVYVHRGDNARARPSLLRIPGAPSMRAGHPPAGGAASSSAPHGGTRIRVPLPPEPPAVPPPPPPLPPDARSP